MRFHHTLVVLAALSFPACTFSRSEINDSKIPQRAKNLQLGKTTADQIIKGIGTPPGQIILLPEGRRLLIYNYGQSKTKGLTLILFNVAKTNVAIDTAIFLVEANGVVTEAWIGDNSEDVPWEWWAFGE